MSKPSIEPDESQYIPPAVTNDVVNAFRDEVNRWFARYMVLYERTTAALTQYRILHVGLISRIYHEMTIALGDRIEEVRQASYTLSDSINDRRAQVGDNACIRDIEAARDANSASVGEYIQSCALYSNTTLSSNLLDTFYPTFATIQAQTSTIPLSVMDILARGNVLSDEQEILQYLADRYQAFEMQWLVTVSQLLRWESSRFNAENLFLADETSICMSDAAWQYLFMNARLQSQIGSC